jgi:DNA-binding HxlR family transcriptional regulator
MVSVLARTAHKWSVLIILVLSDGAKRFSEIRLGLGVTHKVLSRTLQILERDGLIQRAPMAANAARWRYELTCLGQTLVAAVQPLSTWAQANVQHVRRARVLYDRCEREKCVTASV